MRRNFSIGASLAVAAALCVAQGARADVANFNDIATPATTYTHFTNNLYDGGLHFHDNEFDIMRPGLDPQLAGQTSNVLETGSGAAHLEPMTISAYTGNPSHDGSTAVATRHRLQSLVPEAWSRRPQHGRQRHGHRSAAFAAAVRSDSCDSTCHASASHSSTLTSTLTLIAVTASPTWPA